MGKTWPGKRKPPSFDGVESLDFVRGEGSQAVRFHATLESSQNRTENPASQWIYALTSVVFILVGGVAYLKARARKQARNLYAFCTITGCMLLATTTPGEYSLPALAMSFVGLLVFTCAFALFFLNFPASPPVSPRLTRGVAFAVTGGGLAILGFYCATVFGAIDYAPVRTAMLLYLMVCSLVGLWSLGAQLVGHKSHPEARSQLLIVLLGAGLTFFPSAIFNFLPALILGRPLVDIYVCASTLAIMPLAFAYAISRHQLLGIEALVRRSVIQVITGLAILTIMFLPALAFSGPLRGLETDAVPGAVPVALGMIAFALSVIHRTLQGRIERWVDKYIYHDAYDYKQALQSLSRELTSEPDLTRLSRMVLKQLCDLMNLAGAALFLVPESEWETDDSSESAEAAGSESELGDRTPDACLADQYRYPGYGEERRSAVAGQLWSAPRRTSQGTERGAKVRYLTARDQDALVRRLWAAIGNYVGRSASCLPGGIRGYLSIGPPQFFAQTLT